MENFGDETFRAIDCTGTDNHTYINQQKIHAKNDKKITLGQNDLLVPVPKQHTKIYRARTHTLKPTDPGSLAMNVHAEQAEVFWIMLRFTQNSSFQLCLTLTK